MSVATGYAELVGSGSRLPAGREVRELGGIPSLRRPYARAARGALRRGGPTGSRPLPSFALSVSGVRTEREALARYDAVCGFRLSETLPATYPHVQSFGCAMSLLTDPEFPYPLLGLVHVRNGVEVLRGVGAGEPLTHLVWADNTQPHRRGTTFDVVTETRVGDEVVCFERSTYLFRHRVTATGDAAKGGAVDGGSATSESGEQERARAWALWRLPLDLGRRYAAVSGDANPIHLHPLTARAFGFPGAIAHGMWTAARCLSSLEGRLPAAYRFELEFGRPIVLPRTVAFAAPQTGGSRRVSVADPATGSRHLTGTITPLG